MKKIIKKLFISEEKEMTQEMTQEELIQMEVNQTLKELQKFELLDKIYTINNLEKRDDSYFSELSKEIKNNDLFDEKDKMHLLFVLEERIHELDNRISNKYFEDNYWGENNEN